MSEPVELSPALVQDSLDISAKPLSECIESVDSLEGRTRVEAYLATTPYPHYEPAPEKTGWLIRIEADGKRMLGRFVNREFVPMQIPRAKPARR